MSRILVAGCGDIGSALGVRLCSEGHEVWGLRRSAAPMAGGIRALRADLTRPADLNTLPEGLEAVFYIVTPDAFEDAAYAAAFVQGPRNLLRALSSGRHGVRRFLFVSSTSVYGQSDGEWVDETSPTEPGRFSGKRLLEGERIVLDAPIPGVVVRFGGIYGRGETRLLKRVRDGAPCQDAPPQYMNRIHKADCVSVLAHLASLDTPESLYLAVDNAPATGCEVMDWLAAQVGVPAPPRSNMGDGRGSNKRCRNARLLASGYRFEYPSYRDGYAAILRDGSRGG